MVVTQTAALGGPDREPDRRCAPKTRPALPGLLPDPPRRHLRRGDRRRLGRGGARARRRPGAAGRPRSPDKESAHCFDWDGIGDDGRPVPPGPYRLLLTLERGRPQRGLGREAEDHRGSSGSRAGSAAVSEALQVAGCIAAAAAAAAAMLARDRRPRAAALLAALGMALALLLGEGWDELASLRERPAALAALVAAGGAAVGRPGRCSCAGAPCLAAAAGRGAALPHPDRRRRRRGEPAAAALRRDRGRGAGLRARRPRPRRTRARRRPRLLPVALAAAIVLYALQASYSSDIGFATRNVGFFLVPFAAMFVLLCRGALDPAPAGALARGRRRRGGALRAGRASASTSRARSSGTPPWSARTTSTSTSVSTRCSGTRTSTAAIWRWRPSSALAVVMWMRDARRLAVGRGGPGRAAGGAWRRASRRRASSPLLAGVAVLCALRYSLLLDRDRRPRRAGRGGRRGAGPGRDLGGRGLGRGGHAAGAPPWSRAGSTSPPSARWGATARPRSPRRSPSRRTSSRGQTTVSHNEPVTVAAEQGAVGLLAYLGAHRGRALDAARRHALDRPRAGRAGRRHRRPGRGRRGRPALARDRPGRRPSRRCWSTRSATARYLTDPLTWALLAIGAGAGSPGSAASAPGRTLWSG